MKRRLKDAGLRLPPHSFRLTSITDLLEQGVPLADRCDKKITRNIVERISMASSRRCPQIRHHEWGRV